MMQINQFPPQYEEQRKQELERDIHAEQERLSKRQKFISENTSRTVNGGLLAGIGGVIGFAFGLSSCVSMLGAGEFGNGVLSLFFLSIGGAILGAILAGCIDIGHLVSVNRTEKQIAEEQTSSNRVIQELRAHADNEIASYRDEFEAAAQRMSVEYAESALAIDIINWMTEGFSRTIDTTDRRSHIEKINVPFSFNVYKNKIMCNLGTYDFEIMRCANLTSALEQTAIARAIASAVQLNITMKYAKDVSGTAYVLNVFYTYTEDHVSASIIYTAPNGDYRAVQSW